MIDETCTVIASVGGAATGITKYFDPPPASLSTADLPALYVYTGAATDDYEANGDFFTTVTRRYQVQVAVLPRGQANPQDREDKTRPILEAVKKAYWNKPFLGGTVLGLQWCRVVGDSGVVILPDWGAEYVGVSINLEVLSIEQRTLSE